MYVGEDESKKIAERANVIQKIIGTDVPDLKSDEWVAVIIGSQWHPAQFEIYDKESELIKVNVLHRSRVATPSRKSEGKKMKDQEIMKEFEKI